MSEVSLLCNCDCVTLNTEKLLVEMDAGIYFFINQGCLTVDNMDDKAEMQCVEVRLASHMPTLYTCNM